MKDEAGTPPGEECLDLGISEDGRAAKIRELERRIAELRARLPRHSAPATMMIDLDELESALQRLRDELGAVNEHK
jgi:hypothetical protein